MLTTHLSSKGQIVIPSSICKAHRWRPGLEFAIEVSGESIMLRPTRPFAASSFAQVSGCLGHKGGKKSLEEMEKGIKKGAKISDDRR
jgi:AbrB family looped-hinge helix DNA binding protein